mgnify:FL=1
MNPPPKFSRRDYLEHIAEAAELILEYTRGLSKDRFMNDRKTQQAVLMNFMTMGEAAVLLKNEHSAFIAEHADIPWDKMRGMRNILTHEYWNINLEVVWETVVTNVPDLRNKVGGLIDAAVRENQEPGINFPD